MKLRNIKFNFILFCVQVKLYSLFTHLYFIQTKKNIIYNRKNSTWGGGALIKECTYKSCSGGGCLSESVRGLDGCCRCAFFLNQPAARSATTESKQEMNCARRSRTRPRARTENLHICFPHHRGFVISLSLVCSYIIREPSYHREHIVKIYKYHIWQRFNYKSYCNTKWCA